ncbi:MAG: TonB-dependent receptor [Gammaproteobacteria bacterium]|nr:TonB-dependent receptor [Gammaproteobacteria bacterium]MDE0444446.1 TonB-dependent receptor [Gammaproteobacteria bacterium]
MIALFHPDGKRMNSSILSCRSVTLLVLAASIRFPVYAEDADAPDPADGQGEVEELVVVGSLDSLPGVDVRSIYGFDKSILETPRSASTVSEEMMDRYNMSDIDELIVAAPGTFTQSFFGVAGSLDIRGTIGETYFRGVRRLDNPGNYPTPIGASDRIDIVRGPASPIHGPSKIGGYLNFNPKSARIEETGEFIAETTGSVSLNLGSWDKRVVNGELGGPGRLAGRDFGYWLYAELEDSGSYYRNTGTEQMLLQASFDMNPTATLHLQFGGMYHDYTGNQVAGWNRLTQDLIDHGTYVTGSPASLDGDGDGHISHQEFDLDGDGFTDLNPFAAGIVPGTSAPLGPGPFPGACSIGETLVFGCAPEALRLLDPGVATLSGDQVVVAPDDTLENQVLTLYFDASLTTANGWEWRNQVFFETYENLNENDYGFSQFHEAWVFEDKLVLAKEFLRGETITSVQFSPSLRYTDFRHGDDYTNEYFDRRDLTKRQSAVSRRLLSTEIDDDYTEYYIGDYLDLGLAGLVDWSWRGSSALVGVRYDAIAMASRQPVEKLLLASSKNFCLDESCIDIEADDDVGGLSWTASLSYSSDRGFVPYVTMSRQSTVIAGQGAEIATASIANGQAFDVSKLTEFGLKGSLLDGSLYFALAVYEQERTDYAAQQTVTNQASRTEGAEFEVRWAVNENLLLTFGQSRIEVVNLNTLESGARFSFIGADDVPGIPAAALYGGTLGGDVIRPGERGARRAGMPETIYSLTGTYDFGNGLAVTGSLVDVAEAHSGYSNSVLLPAYTLVNVGLGYEGDAFSFSVIAKNVTDERYFRSNFPNLFGGVVVLPELPQHYAARIRYNW